MRRFRVLLVFILFSSPCFGQSLLNVSTGDSVEFSDMVGSSWVVVIFTDQECPYDLEYLERIRQLSRKYSSVRFIRVNTLDKWADTQATMKGFAIEQNLVSEYYFDKEGKLTELLNARKSTQSILLRWREGPVIVYSGAIDSNPLDPTDVRTHYLDDALQDVVSNRKVRRPRSLVVGCMVDK